MKKYKYLLGGTSLIVLMLDTAYAQTSVTQNSSKSFVGLEEVVVTAQKRAESVNDIALSINAATGEQLKNRGISEVADLVKLVPGFSYTESAFGTPVFTLRGVGFYDTSLASKPTVSVYMDEVSLPFSILTRGVSLDLERVEILKGPQGTLFGENSTGGAINYIAAKPTEEFEAGVSVGLERFEKFKGDFYVSGSLSETVTARVALKTVQGGAWQRSITRPGDEIGDSDFTTGRFLLNLNLNDALDVQLNLNGYVDKSDEVVAQYVAFTPLWNPAPGSGSASDLAVIAINNSARAGNNARDADWTPGQSPSRDHSFYQASLRANYEFENGLLFTSISAYSEYDHDQRIDPDGIALNDYYYHTTGEIDALSQELRLSGDVSDRVTFIVGVNYSKDETSQLDANQFSDAPSAYTFTDTFAAQGALGFPPFFDFKNVNKQDFTSKAIFGNIDYDLNDTISLHGGIRYTDMTIDFQGCTVNSSTGSLGAGYDAVLNSIRIPQGLSPTAAELGGCVSIDFDQLISAERIDTLEEDNVSWRVAVDYKPNSDMLLYTSVSRGYKSGSFPLLAASDNAQFDPVTQESVTSYEAGFKVTALDQSAQINGAVFYYDYEDKQLKGRSVATPNIFGPLESLFNVPESSIIGVELQLDIRPMPELMLSIGATYLDSEVTKSFENFDSYGTNRDFKGSEFPYTPKYQIVADVQYDWSTFEKFDAYFGGGFTYQSESISTLGSQTDYQSTELNALGGLEIEEYVVASLRFGIRTKDEKYKMDFAIENLFDTYYWSNATRITDTTVRYAGMPRTYGVSFSARY